MDYAKLCLMPCVSGMMFVLFLSMLYKDQAYQYRKILLHISCVGTCILLTYRWLNVLEFQRMEELITGIMMILGMAIGYFLRKDPTVSKITA